MKRWPNSLAKEERYEKTIGSPSSRTTNKFYQQRTSKKELCRAIPPKNLFQILTFLLYSFLRYLMIAPLGKLPPLMHWRSGRSLSRRGTVEVVLQIYQYKVTSIDAQPYFIRTCFFSREFFLSYLTSSCLTMQGCSLPNMERPEPGSNTSSLVIVQP